MSPGKLSPAPPSSGSWSSSPAPPPCKWRRVSRTVTANMNICSLLQAELALVTLVGGHQTGHELVQGHIAVDNLEQGGINSSVTIVDCIHPHLEYLHVAPQLRYQDDQRQLLDAEIPDCGGGNAPEVS